MAKFQPKDKIQTFQSLPIEGKAPPYNAIVVWCRAQHACIKVRGKGEFTVHVGTLTKR